MCTTPIRHNDVDDRDVRLSQADGSRAVAEQARLHGMPQIRLRIAAGWSVRHRRCESVKIKGRVDGGRQASLLRRQQVPDLAAEHALRDGDDVVAADDAVELEPVGRPERDFRGQAANCRRNRRYRDAPEVRPDKFSGQDQDRACLVEPRDMDRPHYSISIGVCTA